MKVLMVLTNGFDPDVRVYKEAEYILTKGYSVEILCWDRSCEYKEFEQLKGINIRRFPIKSVYGSGLRQIVSYIKFIISIIKYVRKNPCDLIHFHDLDGAIPSLFIRKKNMKYIFDMHELYINGINKYIDFVLLRLLHIVQNKADKIIYVTNMQFKFMKKVNKRKCLFLPNYPSAKIFSSIKKIECSKLRIAYIGSARDFKSLKILIDATKKYKKDFQFRIDGIGSEYANLKKYSEENNYENILTGKYNGIQDIERIYKNTDLLYCVYDNENENWKSGISVKFYEGIITHTPIIVNKGGEEEKMVVKYDIGYVININDPSSFDNMLENISHSDSYKRKVDNIRRIDHLFDWDHIVSILDNIYMNEKTILILSHVGFDDSPYCLFVHDHAKALRGKGYSVIVLAALYWIPFATYLKPDRKKHYQQKKGVQVIDGVTIIYKKTLSLSNLFKITPFNFNGYSYFISFSRVIKKIFKKYNICFVDAHTFEVEGYVAEKIKRKYKVKTFLTLHGTSFRNAYANNFGKTIIKRRAKIIDRYICVSASLERMLKELEITNTKVIFNGLNKFDILDVKKKHSIITVASLRKQKNVDLVIKAIKLLIHKYPDISLTIVGDGDQKNNLMIESEDLLNKNIFFKGALDNFSTQKEMAKHDCFILPSVNEGFGIVYIEAMRNHCITIGTKHEGIDGVLVDNENGYLIYPKVESIVKAIENAFDFPQEIIRENGYNVSINFGWDINAENYIELSEQ